MRRAVLAATLLAACESGATPDAGFDAATADAAVADAGGDDAAVVDAGGEDAAAPDAGPPAMACTASGVTCRPDEYCDRGVGRCRGPGRCMVRPAACADPPAEVCGCDGVTYASACAAYQAGVSIAAEGPC